MPKRVLDGEAMWGSTKLSELPETMVPEYSWFYPLADANGSFEVTNLRVIWMKVSAIRPNLMLEYVQEILRTFAEHGLLFTWERDGKRYGHWTGSDRKGRLPRISRRTERYGPLLAPPVPAAELREYELRHKNVALRHQSVAGFGVGVGLGVGVGEHTAPSAPGACDVHPADQASLEAETKDAAFVVFWEKWPRRQAKANALRAWRKIPIAEYIPLMAGLEKWLTSDQWMRGIIHLPATWLNDRRWQDEDIPQFGGIDGTHTTSRAGKPTATDLALRNARTLGLNGKVN